MKKLLFIIICGLCYVITACSNAEDLSKTSTRIFFVDAQLNRLIAYDRDIAEGDAETMTKSALDVLVTGEDDNDKIRRLIPNDKGALNVNVSGDIAYVDISMRIKDNMPNSRDIEKLFIYQLVNTLTSVKGIRFVKFTIDGAVQKEFMGFYDMREVYKYNYPE